VARFSLKVKARFALVLVVLVPVLFAVGGTAIRGLQSERGSATELYRNKVLGSEAATDLVFSLGIAHAATLELLLDLGKPNLGAPVAAALASGTSNDIALEIATVRANSADSRTETAAVKVIAAGWAHLEQLRAGGALSGRDAASIAVEVSEVEATFDPMTSAAKSIAQEEASQARSAYQAMLATYASSVRLMVLVLVLGLLSMIGVVAWLIRSVLTRTLSYSSFARAVSQGDFSKHLSPRGDDELDQLATTLDQLARRRLSEQQYDAGQAEFTSTLQLTESEQEVHDLMKRYLERTISKCTVTIFKRNNSADRLEAVTPLPEGSPLANGLEAAKPRSCLAVRMARPFVTSVSTDPLLACPVCSGCSDRTLCTPLLVGGEVIGSVLACHDADLTEDEGRSLRDTVTHSAPVLGNLRNLAIAELRSATDALTGLPNRRSIEDTIKRMVAQSSRTMTPLAALMCDLDHFKHINDRFGHASGDEVLAAVGATFGQTLRAADFAGRYGGEEFLLLLPTTDRAGAQEIAGKIRQAVADIRVPTVEDRVTLSVGIAIFPEHAIDAGSLAQAADRALYAAKRAGATARRRSAQVWRGLSSGHSCAGRVPADLGRRVASFALASRACWESM
jgi:diguanylate cyclase (GGDEF)-like protein